MIARIACWIFGILFVGIGLLIVVRGAAMDPYHNALHIATGLAALAVALSRSTPAARRFCLGFGAFYLILGGLGMLLGDPSLDRRWQAGPLSLDVMDHAFHIVLGSIFLVSGVFTRQRAPRSRELAIG
jgi:hypothetical protein